MKKLCGLLLTAGLILFYSCQKEVSFENGDGLSAEGSLQSDLTGDCLPKEVAGTYEAGIDLVPTANAIEVTVNVSKTGPYLIYTDTVNGYYFRASGTFSATGLITVTLPGKGQPKIDGIDNFRVIFDTTECIVPVTVLPAGSSGPAEFTFAGGPGSCMDFSTNGDYVVGTALTASNTVNIKVNVTTPGSFTLTTTASNGMTFTQTGSLLAGEQIITLEGSGTPVSAGVTPIPVEYNGSGCSFSVEVLATAPLKDYFPRTEGSNWSYERDDVNEDSTLLRVKPGGTVTFNGNVFNTFQITDDEANNPFQDVESYRKDGSSYYKYFDIGAFFSLDATQNVEYIFLKDDQSVGTTWTSAEFSNTAGGFPVKLRIKLSIVQKDVITNLTTSIGTVQYPNTIVVEERYEVDFGTGFVDASEDLGYFRDSYSRNVGWVLNEFTGPTDGSNPNSKLELRRYQVNP